MTNPLDLPFSRPEAKAVHEASSAMFSQVYETLRGEPQQGLGDTARSITSNARIDSLTFEFDDLFNDQYSVADLKKANSILGDRAPRGAGGFFDSIQNALEDISPPGFREFTEVNNDLLGGLFGSMNDGPDMNLKKLLPPEPQFLHDLGDQTENLFLSRNGLNINIDELFNELPGALRPPFIGFPGSVPTVSFCLPDKTFAKFAKSVSSNMSDSFDALDDVAQSIPAPQELIGSAVGKVGRALRSIPAPHEVIGSAVGAVGDALDSILIPGEALGAVADALGKIPTPVDAVNDLVEALPSPPEPVRRFLDPFGLFD